MPRETGILTSSCMPSTPSPITVAPAHSHSSEHSQRKLQYGESRTSSHEDGLSLHRRHCARGTTWIMAPSVLLEQDIPWEAAILSTREPLLYFPCRVVSRGSKKYTDSTATLLEPSVLPAPGIPSSAAPSFRAAIIFKRPG